MTTVGKLGLGLGVQNFSSASSLRLFHNKVMRRTVKEIKILLGFNLNFGIRTTINGKFLDELAELEAKAFKTFTNGNSLAHFIALNKEKNLRILYIRNQEKLIGVLIGYERSKENYFIDLMAVAKDSRGKKLSIPLIQALIEMIKPFGYKDIFLECHNPDGSKDKLINYFKAIGFEQAECPQILYIDL